MVEFKLVISDAAKSFARTVGDPQSAGFLGKRIGESVGGELLGLSGYTLKITGGTRKQGLPPPPHNPRARQGPRLRGQGVRVRAPPRGLRKGRAVPRKQESGNTRERTNA